MAGNGLELNKIVSAFLLAGIIAAVSGLTAEGLYAAGEEQGKDAKRGYVVAGAETATTATPAAGSNGGATAAAKEEKPVDITPLLAKADAKAGEQIAKKCAACHTFTKDGKNGVGPNQWGLVGSHFAHRDDYTYSPALMAMKDKKWTPQNLSDFLDNPKKFIPNNKMAFAGIKNPEERANLIAYLSSLK